MNRKHTISSAGRPVAVVRESLNLSEGSGPGRRPPRVRRLRSHLARMPLRSDPDNRENGLGHKNQKERQGDRQAGFNQGLTSFLPRHQTEAGKMGSLGLPPRLSESRTPAQNPQPGPELHPPCGALNSPCPPQRRYLSNLSWIWEQGNTLACS